MKRSKPPKIEILCLKCKPFRVVNTITGLTYQALSDWVFRFDDGQDVLEDADACPVHFYESLEAHLR